MDIDLEIDLRREDDEEEESEEERRKDDESDNEESKTTDVEKVMKKANEVAKKKVARRPRPKLDVDRLIGPKGINELCNLFKEEKFKGKGYEFDDLDLLMNKVQYWAHRLVPHMAFDDFIEKAEHLGSKKSIKNALERLRDQLNPLATTFPVDNERASPTLLDLLPTIEPEISSHDHLLLVPPPVAAAHNDIPDDDELNELLQ